MQQTALTELPLADPALSLHVQTTKNYSGCSWKTHVSNQPHITVTGIAVATELRIFMNMA